MMMFNFSLLPQFFQSSFPGGEGRIGGYLVVEFDAELADGEGIVDEVIGQAGEDILTFWDGDELSDEVGTFGALNVVDALLALGEEGEELRAGLLDAG